VPGKYCQWPGHWQGKSESAHWQSGCGHTVQGVAVTVSAAGPGQLELEVTVHMISAAHPGPACDAGPGVCYSLRVSHCQCPCHKTNISPSH
jgi:hypothetical protein